MKRENWINKLAIESLKANRVRNIMVIISAAVIVMLITTMLNAAISVMISAEQHLTDQIGTAAQCSINDPTRAQIKQLKNLTYVRNVGSVINVGEADYNDRKVTLECVSKAEWEANRKPTVTVFFGEMPEKTNEITLSKSLLKSLDIQKPYRGKKITLACSIGSGEDAVTTKEVFTIAGWYRDERQYNSKTEGIIYVSDQYAKEHGRAVSNGGAVYFSFAKNPLIRELGIIRNVLRKPEIESASQKQIERLEKDLPLRENQEITKVYRSFGYVYNSQSIEPYLFILIPVAICGFLLIFDCFYLSIFKDLKECGLLITAGASLKQLNSILIRQALILGGAGILAGLPLSYLVSSFAVPIYITKIAGEKTYFVWFASSFLLGALFTYAIVGMSVNAVNIYLGRVSTVDLLRGENCRKEKDFLRFPFKRLAARNRKALANGNRVSRMAVSNVMRNAKVNFHVLFSLFIAITLFLLINVVLNGIDPKQFAFNQLDGHDFVLINKTFYADYADSSRLNAVYPQKNVFEDSFVLGLRQLAGVKNAGTIGYLPIALKADLKVLGRFMERFDEENSVAYRFKEGAYYAGDLWLIDKNFIKKSLDKKFSKISNINEFKNGDTVFMYSEMPELFPKKFAVDGYVLSSDQASRLGPPEPIELMVPYSNEKVRENSFSYEKGEIISMPNLYTGMYWSAIPPALFINASEAENFKEKPITAAISIDADRGCRFSLERYLEEVIGDNSLVDFQSKVQLIERMKETKKAVYLLGYTISVMVMLISMLGFVNMAIINTELRKSEFATLRSIGMTKKQLLKMLMAEGLYNAAILIISTTTIGNYIIYKLYSVFGYGDYSFPVVPLVGISLLIIILLSVIPLVVYSSEGKKSISAMLQEIN
jgi:putative ABC transport system permease protein